ncbi:MAG: VWA domain-containing protein, partial [Acidobacteriota bacterium]
MEGRTRRPCRIALAMAAALTALTWVASPSAAEAAEDAGASAVKILMSPGAVADGKTRIETLLLDEDTRELVFLVDGEEEARRKKPPWNAKVPFASPPREQVLTVRALGKGGTVLGEDTAVLNRARKPFRVALSAVERRGDALRVAGEVSVPRGGELTSVEIYLGEQQRAIADGPSFDVEISDAGDVGFARAVAVLADGRTLEDARPLGTVTLEERVAVELVQLQVLATLRDGRPVAGLGAEDFVVTERGEDRAVARAFPADDVALAFGLVIDSSGSMETIWGQTRSAAETFLARVLTPKDRAFVVDFDSGVRLVHPLDGDVAALAASLDRVRPDGLTALYDSVAFSMLRLVDVPGRRALVLLTDGFDHGSHTDPKRAVELGAKLGVPVYVVAMPSGGGRQGLGGASAAVQELKLLTDPTGGRLIRAGGGGLGRAFGQIAAELRNQYVLFYYTDRPLEDLDGR